MLIIRLQRVGRRNDPSFRVVVADKRRSAKAGRFVEILGSYNPRRKTLQLKEDRIKHWLSVGAKASGTAHNLMVSKNIISGAKINVSAQPKKEKEKTLVQKPETAGQAPAEKKPAGEKIAQEAKS